MSVDLTSPEELELARRRPVDADVLLAVLDLLPPKDQDEALRYWFLHDDAGHGPIPAIASVESLPKEAQGPWARGGAA